MVIHRPGKVLHHIHKVVHKNLFFPADRRGLSTRFVEKYIIPNIWPYPRNYRMEIQPVFEAYQVVFINASLSFTGFNVVTLLSELVNYRRVYYRAWLRIQVDLLNSQKPRMDRLSYSTFHFIPLSTISKEKKMVRIYEKQLNVFL
jgi:hypothetical protein